MIPTAHPIHRCSDCDLDWPAHKDYNLCPRCQKCTWATTSSTPPDHHQAKRDATRFEAYRDFDRRCDAGELDHQILFAAQMSELLKQTPTIPDPDPTPQNYGLAGVKERNAQDVRHWDGDNA